MAVPARTTPRTRGRCHLSPGRVTAAAPDFPGLPPPASDVSLTSSAHITHGRCRFRNPERKLSMEQTIRVAFRGEKKQRRFIKCTIEKRVTSMTRRCKNLSLETLLPLSCAYVNAWLYLCVVSHPGQWRKSVLKKGQKSPTQFGPQFPGKFN